MTWACGRTLRPDLPESIAGGYTPACSTQGVESTWTCNIIVASQVSSPSRRSQPIKVTVSNEASQSHINEIFPTSCSWLGVQCEHRNWSLTSCIIFYWCTKKVYTRCDNACHNLRGIFSELTRCKYRFEPMVMTGYCKSLPYLPTALLNNSTAHRDLYKPCKTGLDENTAPLPPPWLHTNQSSNKLASKATELRANIVPPNTSSPV